MDAPCYITGTGLVSARGLNVAENWSNLLAGRVLRETGIVPLPRDQSLPRVSQLAIAAAREAHAAAGQPELADGRTALVVGTSKGPIEDWIDQLDGRRPADLSLGVSRVAVDVAAALGHAGGPRLTYAGACASGLHALIQAVDLIRGGQCDQALVVAAEASTHPLFEANFKRLGVLAAPGELCRPFDRRRRGFFLAEAAAAVMISRRPTADGLAVTKTACFADAIHLTGPDPAGAALGHALAAVDGDGVALVHAHGTGTVQNDAVELDAIARVLGRRRLSVYSHKHVIGHTQGAAGLIGIVITAQAHRQHVVPGNAATDEPIGDHYALAIHTTAALQRIRQSVCIAAGFGGTVAAIQMAANYSRP